MPMLRYRNAVPRVHPSAYVAPGASVIGDVVVGRGSSLWFGVVARGDINAIRIGERTNIQDGTVIHVSTGGRGTHIGNNVTVGHMAVVHDCTLEDDSFVGIKACIMDGSVVESGAMVAAGALVTPGKTVASGELWAGVPARCIRPVSEKEKEMLKTIPAGYVQLAAAYLGGERDGADE
jgi:carbonic anhydrase/acetyltransferase-like protein (isoleucine patch superfamily)